MEMFYRARPVPNDAGGYIVTFPDVPDAITEGASLEEALANAEDALAVALLGRMVDGEAIPAPEAKGRDLAPVALPAQAAAKLAVYMAFRTAGISKIELARRLGKQEAEARRILDPYHATKLETLDAALHALGQRMVITTVEAA